MKANQPAATHNFFAVALFVLLFAGVSQTYAQADFFYGLNNKGLRISAGFGASTLQTHFNSNPLNVVFIGNLDYNINRYVSFGLEGQYGTLKGIDDEHRLKYYGSTNKYFSATANASVGLGKFADFTPNNRLQDAIKQLYLGIGIGAIKTNNVLVEHDDKQGTIYGNPQLQGKYLLLAANLGTIIDLPGILGPDRLAIIPNFQLNYVNSLYLDGFQSSQDSNLKGFYNIISVKLRYKFKSTQFRKRRVI
ncbi:hypothetical protein [Mucilaginibacter gracilis]|nr:hypothetical protein [Mucilaginibacter gracilis]